MNELDIETEIVRMKTRSRERINPATREEWPHPSRVTASEDAFQVTGLLPKCPECPLADGHDGVHLSELAA